MSDVKLYMHNMPMNNKTIFSTLLVLFLIPQMGQASPCSKQFTAMVSSTTPTGPKVFRNISMALKQAAKQGACKAQIIVQAGHYNEPVPLLLKFPLTIKGAGATITETNSSLRNYSGHSLTISNISFVKSPLAAIIQSGGKLKLDGVNFSGTILDSTDIKTGIALLLSRGAIGSFRFLNFNWNYAGAIRASDSGTSFYCGGCIFKANKVHPLALVDGENSKELMGSVSLNDGALGSIELSNFTGNEIVAIQLQRARIFLKNTIVQSSVPIDDFGGSGLVLQEGSQAIGERVRFLNHPLTGISIFTSRLTLRRSVIQNNLIGLAVRRMEAGFDWLFCLDDTQFRDNRRHLDADVMPGPVPEPHQFCPNWEFPTNP